MSYYLKSGKTFQVTSKEAMDLHDFLPPANYVIKIDPVGNLYLETIDSFEIKFKQYGDLTSNRDRIMSTFKSRNNSTGVMLNGEKGSGKSLLAKAISIAGYGVNIPTIVVNSPMHGDKFNSFLQSIDQPTIILFDEFEKVYASDEQEQILTLLDGVFPSKKLFILTCNDKWRIDTHMRNRPGRIFYMLDFKGLSKEFIIEYCKDNLKDQSHIEKICAIAALFSEFNFDMLKALIEEMNRYNEAPEKSLKMLNAKPEFDIGNITYSVIILKNNIPLPEDDIHTKTWTGNPLFKKIEIQVKEYYDDNGDPIPDILNYHPSLTKKVKKPAKASKRDFDYVYVYFEQSDLQKINTTEGKYIFLNEDKYTLIITKLPPKESHYFNAL